MNLFKLFVLCAITNVNVAHGNEATEEPVGEEVMKDENSESNDYLGLRLGREPEVPEGVTVETDSTGLTTYTQQVNILYWLRQQDFCFDPYQWCTEYLLNFDVDWEVESEGYAYALASAWSHCWVATKAFSEVQAIIDATASFQVKQRGRIGAIREAKFDSSLQTAQLSVAYSEALSEVVAEADGYGVAYTNPEVLCSTMSPPYNPYYYYLCGDGWGEAEAYGYSSADATASSFSDALAYSISQNYVRIEANGKSLQNFNALVVGGASSFTTGESNTIALAYADAAMDLYAESWTENCQAWYAWYCGLYHANFCVWNNFCNDAYAKAQASADSIAIAFGKAVAKAVARIDVTVAVKAHFHRGTFGRLVMGLDLDSRMRAAATVTCTA